MGANITDLTVLANGKLIPLAPGDTLVIEVSFKYTVSQGTTVTLWASLGLGVGRDIESFKEISLEASLTPKTWSGTTEIVIPTSGKSDGTYWMKVEVDGNEVTVPDAVVISGMSSIMSMIPMLMMVMMMGMMMPMMEEV
jgi:hypothetical protein